MKRPMMTDELYNKICGILKEQGKMPDILDYGLPTYHPVPITNYEFDLRSDLNYGGNEGIYLNLWIEYHPDGEKRIGELGIFKTLCTDQEAMHVMAGLLADFIIEESAYVNANLDDFTWEGADVHPMDETGKQASWGYSCKTIEAAMKRKEELLTKYPKVVVRNNATRKEKIYEKKDCYD